MSGGSLEKVADSTAFDAPAPRVRELQKVLAVKIYCGTIHSPTMHYQGGSLMSLSSNHDCAHEALAFLEHGPQDIDAATRERNDGLVVPFSLAAFAGVESLAVGAAQGSKGGLVKHSLKAIGSCRIV
jgi:hypothetical protein